MHGYDLEPTHLEEMTASESFVAHLHLCFYGGILTSGGPVYGSLQAGTDSFLANIVECNQ